MVLKNILFLLGYNILCNMFHVKHILFLPEFWVILGYLPNQI